MTDDGDATEGEEAKPKRTRRRRKAMPEAMKVRAEKAGREHRKRWGAPDVDMVPHGDGVRFVSPYRSEDEREWWALLLECFGTRLYAVADVFLTQIAGLLETYWDEEARGLRPDDEEVRAALCIVASLKPKNEAEAAHAAQAVALHLAAMKTGKRIAGSSSVDPRQVNALSNLVKAYSGVMDSMRKRGRSSSSRQTIVVKKNVQVNVDNRRVTLGGEGVSAANQPDGAEGTTRARPRNGDAVEGRTYAAPSLAALPSPEEVRGSVQSPCDEGPQRVPVARRKVAGGTEG